MELMFISENHYCFIRKRKKKTRFLCTRKAPLPVSGSLPNRSELVLNWCAALTLSSLTALPLSAERKSRAILELGFSADRDKLSCHHRCVSHLVSSCAVVLFRNIMRQIRMRLLD